MSKRYFEKETKEIYLTDGHYEKETKESNLTDGHTFPLTSFPKS
jgi:hypothetical protein